MLYYVFEEITSKLDLMKEFMKINITIINVWVLCFACLILAQNHC